MHLPLLDVYINGLFNITVANRYPCMERIGNRAKTHRDLVIKHSAFSVKVTQVIGIEDFQPAANFFFYVDARIGNLGFVVRQVDALGCLFDFIIRIYLCYRYIVNIKVRITRNCKDCVRIGSSLYIYNLGIKIPIAGKALINQLFTKIHITQLKGKSTVRSRLCRSSHKGYTIVCILFQRYFVLQRGRARQAHHIGCKTNIDTVYDAGALYAEDLFCILIGDVHRAADNQVVIHARILLPLKHRIGGVIAKNIVIVIPLITKVLDIGFPCAPVVALVKLCRPSCLITVLNPDAKLGSADIGVGVALVKRQEVIGDT